MRTYVWQILMILVILIFWHFNHKKVENFKQDKLLNKIYRDLTLEEFEKDLKHNEIHVPKKLSKILFYRFKKRSNQNNITADYVIEKLRHFDNKGKKISMKFLKQYMKNLKETN